MPFDVVSLIARAIIAQAGGTPRKIPTHRGTIRLRCAYYLMPRTGALGLRRGIYRIRGEGMSMNGLARTAFAVVALAVFLLGCGGSENTPAVPAASPTLVAPGETTAPPPTAASIPATEAATRRPTANPTPALPTATVPRATPKLPPTVAPAATPAATAAPFPTAAPASATGERGPAGPAGAAGPAGSDGMSVPTPAMTADVVSEAEGGSAPAMTGEIAPYRQVSLSAGEVDDNRQWQEYLEYLAEYQGPPAHEVDVSERYIITVRGGDGRPLPNALVRVVSGEDTLFEGLTYANGQTLFFPRALLDTGSAESFRVSAEKGGVSLGLDFPRGAETDWNLTLDATASYDGGVPLDVLFLLDSTGSMADEIDRIKDTLLSISARISDLPSQPDLRLGMVSYRDRGDEYVTRVFDFDADAWRFSDTIRSVQADGGGDEPESLNEALHVALNEPDWRDGDAVRLVFLLADAPPHLDYPQDYDYAEEMVEARKRGIKIFSVASSGLNVRGEYIFRQIAQHTMGRFIFILYESPGGGVGTPHDVGEYTIERLDSLIVRLVEEELAALNE